MAFGIGKPDPLATAPWYERMNPFGSFVPAEEKGARADALLQMGLGILANNQGNYGSFLPALSRGGMMGMQAYQQALQAQSGKKRQALQDRLLQSQIGENQAQAQERASKMAAEERARARLGQVEEEWRSKFMPQQAQQGAMPTYVVPSLNDLPPKSEPIPGRPELFTARIGDASYATYRVDPNAKPANYDPNSDPVALRQKGIMLQSDPLTARYAKQYFDLAGELTKAQTTGKSFQKGEDGQFYVADLTTGSMTPVPGTAGTAAPKPVAGMPYVVRDPKTGQIVVDDKLRKLYLQDREASATRLNFGQPVAVTTPEGEQKLVQFDSKGNIKDTGFRPAAGAGGKTTEQERLAKGYHDRMVAAESILQGIGAKGFPNEATAAARSMPLIGAYVERRTMTPEQQKFRQAQEDWVRSKLRKESGAAIGKEEMNQEIATYFPQPGDGPDVVKQKEASRAVAITAMRDAAGGAIQGNASQRGSFQDQSMFGGGELPKAARMNLKEGVITNFKNGQSWTLRNGQPVRVK